MNSKSVFHLAIVFLGAILAGCVWSQNPEAKVIDNGQNVAQKVSPVAVNQENGPSVPSTQSSTTPVIVTPKKEYHQLSTDEYYYDVVYDDAVNVGDNDFYSNPQFMRTDKSSGEKVVLFADLEKVTKPTNEREGYSVYAFSKGKNTLYLASFIGETESPLQITWKLDLTTKKLEPLKFNTDKNVNIKGESWLALSNPNKLKFVKAVYKSEGNEFKGFTQQLVLYDLENETITLLVQLSDMETLNGGYYAMSENIDAKWVDENTIEYSVFDQSGRDEYSDAKKTLIEKRRVQINSADTI